MRPAVRTPAAGWGLSRTSAGIRHVQTVVLAAVVTVLLTRLALSESGYPKVGVSHLHIAHALWGGLLMLLAVILQLTLVGPRLREVTSIVGGVGFGLFIDEVGKLVGRANGYFYEPAVAIMYVTFVALLALAQLLLPAERMGPGDRLTNVALTASTHLRRGLTPRQRAQAEDLVRDQAGTPEHAAVMGLLQACPYHVSRLSGLSRHTQRWTARVREGIEARTWLWLFVVVALALQSGAGVVVLEALGIDRTALGYAEVDSILPVVSSLLSLTLTTAGVAAFPWNRLLAYRLFAGSLVVSMLVTQVFVFAEYRFFGLYGLTVNAIAYWVVGVKIRGLQMDSRNAPGETVDRE
ncbi:hypothetical protein [Embleya scabrispora]|uniref:hypothetical protein n=1 Tax=Embleya scabrispora TaxID=159449 RepID=UPI0003664594|nr:hypothetical protein [Embleya scabrispora]MYS82526.1 hypothetical protein [Streptomyces sp. SID5474]